MPDLDDYLVIMAVPSFLLVKARQNIYAFP